MKRIIFIFAVCFAAMTLFAVDGQFFTAKKGSPAEGAVLVRKNATLALAFKLAPDAPENFNLANIYMFTDSDRNTGRKGIGNEYYFDIAKGQMSSYAADGQGTLHRNALTVLRAGQWYIITFDESITAGNPIKEFEIIFNGNGKRGVVNARGKGAGKVDVPDFPERGKKAAPAPAGSKSAAAVKPAASFGEVEVFLAPSLAQLQSAADSTKLKKLEINALRNSYEDFQLAVWFGKPDRGTLRLYWDDIKDADGKKLTGAKLKFFHFVKVPFSEPIANNVKRSIKVSSKEPVLQKMVPDRLTPYAQGAKAGDYKLYLAKTFTVWYATAFFPAETKPGKYSADLRLTYPGGEEKLTVVFDVRDFVVPDRPNFVMFADMPRLVNYVSRFNENKAYPNAMTLDLEACLKDMSEHRVALRSLPAKVGLTFDEKEQPVLDFSKFDPLASYVLDELKMNTRMEMPLATVSTGHSSNYTKLYGPIDSTQISDEFRRKYTATLRATLKHLREKGWDKYFFAYYSDEPARSDFGQMAEVARIIKAADKSLVPWIYGPGPREEFMDVLDTWMGGFGTPLEEGEIQGDANGKCVSKAIARGDRIGVYNPHPAYALNVPPTFTRTLYWWAYQQNLYWMSMYCLGYFTTGPQDLTNRRYWHYWVYPPTPGNAMCWESSIRWEATRDGMIDYELLFAAQKSVERLKKQLPSAAKLSDKCVALEYANAVSFNRENRSEDAALLKKVRDRLIGEVEQLSEKANREIPAFAHYRFENGMVKLEVYAPEKTVVRFSVKGTEPACVTVAGNSPAVHTLPTEPVKDQIVEITLDGKRTIYKQIFMPYGK